MPITASRMVEPVPPSPIDAVPNLHGQGHRPDPGENTGRITPTACANVFGPKVSQERSLKQHRGSRKVDQGAEPGDGEYRPSRSKCGASGSAVSGMNAACRGSRSPGRARPRHRPPAAPPGRVLVIVDSVAGVLGDAPPVLPLSRAASSAAGRSQSRPLAGPAGGSSGWAGSPPSP